VLTTAPCPTGARPPRLLLGACGGLSPGHPVLARRTRRADSRAFSWEPLHRVRGLEASGEIGLPLMKPLISMASDGLCVPLMPFDCLPHQVSARRVLVRPHHHGTPGRCTCWHAGPHHRRLLVPDARWQLCAVRYRARRAIGRLRAAAAASPNGGRAVHAQRTRLRCRRPGRRSCGGRLNSHPLLRGAQCLSLRVACATCEYVWLKHGWSPCMVVSFETHSSDTSQHR